MRGWGVFPFYGDVEETEDDFLGRCLECRNDNVDEFDPRVSSVIAAMREEEEERWEGGSVTTTSHRGTIHLTVAVGREG